MAIIQFKGFHKLNEDGTFTISFGFGAKTILLVDGGAFATAPISSTDGSAYELNFDENAKMYIPRNGVTKTFSQFYDEDGKDSTGSSSQGVKMGLYRYS